MEKINWDNSKAYVGFNDPQIELELTQLKEITKLMDEKVQLISKTNLYNKENLILAQEITTMELDAYVNLYSLSQYASMAKSVDNLNQPAKDLLSKISKISSELSKTLKPVFLFILTSPEDFLANFLDHPRTKEIAFQLKYQRTQNDFLLSKEEEIMETGLGVDGLHAWGKLYSEIAGKLQVDLGDKKVGVAQAAGLLKQDNREMREKAFRGINEAWTKHEDTAAAILNSINGWRLESNKLRSKKKERHYLDVSCHQSRITRKTLDTLMDVTFEKREIGQNAIRYMAGEIGVSKIAPWDLLASMPEKGQSKLKSFGEGIEIIKEAFKDMNSEMADFVDIMVKNKWFDVSESNNRSPGAYCTSLSKLREPRVFMTYLGSMNDILTLAHEIGHAYHNWVMKDLSIMESRYSMTLAETASIFAETLVKDFMLKNATNELDKKRILWQECESASSLLINIPTRFEFEKRLVEERKNRDLNANDLKKMMSECQMKWYGETLSEYDDMFWASKLHFHMSGLGFYNYPYLFGYLFSIGIYAKRDEYKNNFSEVYINLLRDTGIMTAEDLVMKHFGEDISEKKFWEKSLSKIQALTTI